MGHTGNAESTGQKSIRDLEESSRLLLYVRDEFSIRSHFVKSIEQSGSWDLDIVEEQPTIVDAVQGHLMAHVFDSDIGHGFKIVIPNLNDESIDAFVFPADNCLGKDNSMVCMTSTVGDPVLLG